MNIETAAGKISQSLLAITPSNYQSEIDDTVIDYVSDNLGIKSTISTHFSACEKSIAISINFHATHSHNPRINNIRAGIVTILKESPSHEPSIHYSFEKCSNFITSGEDGKETLSDIEFLDFQAAIITSLHEVHDEVSSNLNESLIRNIEVYEDNMVILQNEKKDKRNKFEKIHIPNSEDEVCRLRNNFLNGLPVEFFCIHKTRNKAIRFNIQIQGDDAINNLSGKIITKEKAIEYIGKSREYVAGYDYE